VNDASGRDLEVGDQVAHIRKTSGSRFVARIGRILQSRPSQDFYAKDGELEVQLVWLADGWNANEGQRSAWIAPHNLVVLKEWAE
jgi:hypothetical protein